MKTKRKIPKGLISKSPIYTAFLSARKTLKLFFFISLSSVLLIEFFLKNISAPLILITLGGIYLKLCYSMITSLLFLFINIQIPKEQKKLKSFVFVNNRITILYRHLGFLVTLLKLQNVQSPSRDDFKNASSNINPNSKVETFIGTTYETWQDFITFLGDETNRTLHDLLPLNENIDTDILESLFAIENLFHTLSLTRKDIFKTKEGWEFVSGFFYDINLYSLRLIVLTNAKYKFTSRQYQERHYREHILPNLEEK